MKKKGQITIFIIIGILIVGLVIAFLYLRDELTPGGGGKPGLNTATVLESCLEDKVKETVKTITENGGYLNSTLNITFQFKGNSKIQEIAYLCYTYQGYIPCMNQAPLLMEHIEKEIEKGISAQTRICFDEVVSNLGRQGETIDAIYRGFDVKLSPGKINVYVDGDITSTKSGKTTKQIGINGTFSSRLYEITRVVQEIVNQEATYCNFQLVGFMLFYPEFQIDKAMTRDSTAIYTVMHEKGVERFDFAVRSCYFPPGI